MIGIVIGIFLIILGLFLVFNGGNSNQTYFLVNIVTGAIVTIGGALIFVFSLLKIIGGV
jgi:drug/metabolite transporter (DMT)-like permease